jgi:Beta protein
MDSLDVQTYCPVLRLKAGECDAVSLLVPSVRNRILPLFVLPPPDERDSEFLRRLTASELVGVNARRVGKVWPFRPCLLDPRFLFDALDVNASSTWLPEFFRLSRSASANPWLVADLQNLESFMYAAAQEVLRSQQTPFVLRLKPEDIEDDELSNRIQRILLSLVRKPSETLLLLDFGNSIDHSNTAEVAEIMVATLQRVSEIGLWAQVVWQSTTYPEVNPAPAGDMVILNRGEWTVYQQACSIDSMVRSQLMFGDYAADSAKFNFGASGGRAIAHFRYSTASSWLVSRGAKDGKLAEEMPKVAKRILSSNSFAGETFSRGDLYISEVAAGNAIGQARNWRCANTAHHLTRVTSDIGSMSDFSIEKIPVRERWQQFALNV